MTLILPAQIHAPAFHWARHRREQSSLSLQRTTTGWALLDSLGQPVFEATGRDARQACLARAQALGVLRLTSDDHLPTT
jgi:hypothetical protein